jgi:hypothetical protein
MKISTSFCIGFISLMLCYPGMSQSMTQDIRELESRFLLSRKTSNDLQVKYRWNMRTDVSKEGKVMDILIQQFSFDANGKRIQKIINDQEAKLPSSFLIHGIAEEEKTKTVNFMNGLHHYLEEYSLSEQNQLNMFFSKVRMGGPDPQGQIMLTGENVLCNGDRVNWWIDHHTFSLSKVTISTEFEGDQVEFTATYSNLAGLNYMAFAEVIIPSKSIIVQLHSYDYTKND